MDMVNSDWTPESAILIALKVCNIRSCTSSVRVRETTSISPGRNESLFVLGPGAVLVEYKFECNVLHGVSPVDDAPVQLTATPTIQWTLARSARSEQVLLFNDISLLSQSASECSSSISFTSCNDPPPLIPRLSSSAPHPRLSSSFLLYRPSSPASHFRPPFLISSSSFSPLHYQMDNRVKMSRKTKVG